MQTGASYLSLLSNAFEVSSTRPSTVCAGTRRATGLLHSRQSQTSCEYSQRINEEGSITPVATGIALVLLIY